MLKKIVTHENAPYYAAAILTVACAAFALGAPQEIGGVLTILGAGFFMFKAAYEGKLKKRP